MSSVVKIRVETALKMCWKTSGTQTCTELSRHAGMPMRVFLILRLASLAWSWATLNFETDSFLCSAAWMGLMLTLKLCRGIEDFVLEHFKSSKNYKLGSVNQPCSFILAWKATEFRFLAKTDHIRQFPVCQARLPSKLSI